jgi:hypothetical protein
MSVRPPRSLGQRPEPGALDALEYELLQEKASTLARVTQALAAFVASEEKGLGESSGDARREQLLDAAGEALWNFVVQREICGLRNTEAALRDYRVPAAVRLRIGVVRRR